MSLERGQKIKIANIITENKLSIEISAYDNHGLIYDMSVFGLDVSGKCSDEDYFIFYNQRQSPENSIILARKVEENKENFNIFLDRIPAKINRLVFTLTVDGSDNMSKLSNGALIISDSNSQVCSFNFKGADFNSERAIMIGELYFINNEWRFGAIGQGFNGGLSALLKHFGIKEIVESEPVNNSSPTPTPTPTPTPINRFSSFVKDLFAVPIDFFEKKHNEIASKQEAKRQENVATAEKNRKKQLFQNQLINALSDGVLTKEEMNSLDSFCQQNELNLQSCLSESQQTIISFIRRFLIEIVADNEVTQEEEDSIDAVCSFLNPPQYIKNEVKERINRVKNIQKIKSGHITHIVGLPIITKTDELIWHHKKGAELVRDLQSRINLYKGELYITSQRIIFESREHPIEIALSNILRIDSNLSSVFISGKSKKTTCQFRVQDADILEAYLEQAIAKFHRKLNIKQTSGNTRKISQAVKQNVWQRDGGQCVQCSAADYLEFDHIIPFSKGGSSSENNVQLLCRRCNLAKSDRL